MTKIKLPDWTGDTCTKELLEAGDLRAMRTCDRTLDALDADGLTLNDCEWNADVWRQSDGAFLFRSDEHYGEIIGRDMARAMCEVMIKLAMRADAAEKRVADLPTATLIDVDHPEFDVQCSECCVRFHLAWEGRTGPMRACCCPLCGAGFKY